MTGHRGTTPERHPWFLAGANAMTQAEAEQLFDCIKVYPVSEPTLDVKPNNALLPTIRKQMG
jgi:hypothetical protein